MRWWSSVLPQAFAIFLSLVIAWGIWVTRSLYESDKAIAKNAERLNTVCQNEIEIVDHIKMLELKIEKMREENAENYRALIQHILDMKDGKR